MEHDMIHANFDIVDSKKNPTYHMDFKKRLGYIDPYGEDAQELLSSAKRIKL